MSGPPLFWRKRANPGQVKLLTGPQPTSPETQAESLSARTLLGITTRPGKNGEGIVKSLSLDGMWRSIAHHQSSTFIDGSGLELARIFGFTPEITLLVRAVRQNPVSFLRHLQDQRGISYTTIQTQFLDDIQEWALPRKASQIYGHDLLIWGPNTVIVPESREETAALYGRVVNYFQLGPVMRSVLYGLPMDMSEMRKDPLTGNLDPGWYAAPRQVVWHNRFYVLPDVNRAFAFFSGVITPENIGQVLELGDLLLKAENVQRNLFFSALLRVSVPANGKPPDFEPIVSQLVKLGKFEMRSGSDLRSAFQAFVPGSAPQPSWHRHSVAKAVPVLKAISQPLRTVGDRQGTNMIGVIDGQPLLLDPWLRPGRLYEAPSKAGKSTLAAAHAAQITKRIIWIPLSAGLYEGAPHWVSEMGGRVISLNLPDAYTLLQQAGGRLDKTTITKKQEELHTQDRAHAEEVVRTLTDEWERRGGVTGLPLTFNVETGDTVRLLNWYTHFLAAFREAWKPWFEKTGDQVIVVGDNFSALRLSENDPLLGDIPESVGRNLGLTFAWLVSNGRNMGVSTWVLTHSVEDLDYISTGFYSQFGLHLSLRHDDYTMAAVIQPKEREVLAPQVHIRLPQPIRALFERREPGREGVAAWPASASAQVAS